jgi:hypothetical protein
MPGCKTVVWSCGSSGLARRNHRVPLPPHELLERLVALVPRPRRHLTRYHGVLAPAFAGRSEIVPLPSGRRPPPDRPTAPAGTQPPERPGRWPWASLIWRVFLKDALVCVRCCGRMAIVAAVTAREPHADPETSGSARRVANLPRCPSAATIRACLRRCSSVRARPARPGRLGAPSPSPRAPPRERRRAEGRGDV